MVRSEVLGITQNLSGLGWRNRSNRKGERGCGWHKRWRETQGAGGCLPCTEGEMLRAAN